MVGQSGIMMSLSDETISHFGEMVSQSDNLCYLHEWLTVHRSITLFDLQLDAQKSYIFAYNTFIKILYMFRALPCLSSGGLRRNCTGCST